MLIASLTPPPPALLHLLRELHAEAQSLFLQYEFMRSLILTLISVSESRDGGLGLHRS